MCLAGAFQDVSGDAPNLSVFSSGAGGGGGGGGGGIALGHHMS